jgi:excisionase family DNA binding protein
MKHWLHSGQVARVLGVSEGFVHQLVKAGKLKAMQTALGKLYRPAEVERLRAERAERKAQKVATETKSVA